MRWALIAPPNGLALSCAAPIDRDDSRAESSFQNRRDLRAACGVSSSTVLGRREAAHGVLVAYCVPQVRVTTSNVKWSPLAALRWIRVS